MACLELDSSQFLSYHPSYDGPFNLQLEGRIQAELLAVPDASTSLSQSGSAPKPPPLPNASYSRTNFSKGLTGYSYVPNETKHVWERLFDEGYEADVRVLTDDKGIVSAHSCVLASVRRHCRPPPDRPGTHPRTRPGSSSTLTYTTCPWGIASPVLRNMLDQARVKDGFRCIRVPGVPLEAARAFTRFLYSACYEQDEMKKYVLHLLVMSHAFSVPSLKKVCVNQLERAFFTAENVVDVLQLARQCDAPRLSLLCIGLIIKDFRTISTSEGWKVMKQVNPSLEQELLESLVEVDSKRQDQMKKKEERKIYMQLNEAMEALLHICKDGCRTIGPRDQMLRDSQATCGFPACKGLESLVRHFSGCKTRVPGGCMHCKRMWQLFELHSGMCSKPDSCKIPLCRHFKDKMQHQNKKEQLKWKLLVRKVMAAKGTISSISAWRSCVA